MVDRRSEVPVASSLTGAAGAVYGERYRLTTLVHLGRSELWRAEDDVLARPVAARVLAADTDDQTRTDFLSAAAQAGRYAGPGVASVFDAATQDDPARPGLSATYVVAAWIDGPTLETQLRQAPYDVPAAVALVTALCDTLGRAHAAGVFARRLHPGHVVLSPTGDPVVVDLEVSAVLHDTGDAPRGHDELAAVDTRDLARVLYAALTGVWPVLPHEPDPYTGLSPAPLRDGRLCLPRQVRAGLPRSLDAVIARALEPRRRPSDPPLVTPAQLAQALSRLAVGGAPGETVPAAEESSVPTRPRRRRLLLLPAFLVLVAIGVAAFLLGLVVGRVPGLPSTAARVPGLHASPSAGAPADQPLSVDAVNSFDPQSSDRSENESTVPNAFDGNPATSWVTEQYSTVNFGGLGKTGVGLLVDLGSPKAVTRVVLTAPPGQTIEILAAPGATSAPTTESPTVTPAVTAPTVTSGTGDTTLTVSKGTVSQWYVVWITGLAALPAPAHGFGGTIAELALYG